MYGQRAVRPRNDVTALRTVQLRMRKNIAQGSLLL